jgi:lysyl-tRNA synthetase class 2
MEERLIRLKELGVSEPYASESHRDTSISAARELAPSKPDKVVTVAGRIVGIRKYGKLIFCDLEDQETKIQIIFSQKNMGENSFAIVDKGIQSNDLVEVSGLPTLSKTGEPSIMAQNSVLVAPCLEKLDEIKDVATRFSNRTRDMLVNQESKKRLLLRSKILHQTRSILEKYGFLETTTPVLQGKYGGGQSNPFISHCNSLKQDMFLRATMDLYLKRIVAGGIERVYEIGKCFRNEGISSSYNPEFLILEAYAAYLPSSELAKVVKEIVDTALKTTQKTFPEIWGNGDISWRNVDYTEGCRDYLGVDVSDFHDIDGIKRQCANKNYNLEGANNLHDVHAKLAEVILGKNFIEPTMLSGLPLETSPLMKANKENPKVLDRSWFFANGVMFCDLAGELSDPTEQVERLKEQKKDLSHDYDNMDVRHIEALRLGCPSMSGIGMGFDRFLMAITKANNTRENIPFPIAYEVLKAKPQTAHLDIQKTNE